MYKKFKTKNGLTVAVSPMPHMTSISLAIWIGVGGRYETVGQSGISHLVEHMLFKGTHHRTAKDLKETIEGVGGAFNGFTADEVTCYMVKVPSKYMELGVDVLSDMVMDPAFDPGDLEKEKFVVCEEIKMYRDQPADYVLDLLGEIMWAGNALGRPLTGTSATVRAIDRSALVNFKNKYYHPGNVAIVAAGKVDPEKLFDRAALRFKTQKRRKNASFRSPMTVQKKFRMKVGYKNITQVHVAMGFHAVGNNIRERFAIKLMNVILGGNMSSRLFEELREKNGLCYDIASAYKRHSDVGEVHLHAGVDSGKAGRSVIAILDELKKIKNTGVTADELNRAKKYIKGQFLLAIEGTATRMMWLGDRLVVHKSIPEVNKVLKQIDSVTKDEIRKVSRKIFAAKAANLAMVGKVGAKTERVIVKELKKL